VRLQLLRCRDNREEQRLCAQHRDGRSRNGFTCPRRWCRADIPGEGELELRADAVQDETRIGSRYFSHPLEPGRPKSADLAEPSQRCVPGDQLRSGLDAIAQVNAHPARRKLFGSWR